MTTNQITLFQFEYGTHTTLTSNGCAAQRRCTGTSDLIVYKLSKEPAELTVDQMFVMLEQNDLRAAAATEAGTKWVAETFFTDAPPSLAKLRMQSGLTQRDLGKRLNVSQPQIAKWEKGEMPNMQLRTVKSLAEALSVSVPDLIEVLLASNEPEDIAR